MAVITSPGQMYMPTVEDFQIPDFTGLMKMSADTTQRIAEAKRYEEKKQFEIDQATKDYELNKKLIDSKVQDQIRKTSHDRLVRYGQLANGMSKTIDPIQMRGFVTSAYSSDELGIDPNSMSDEQVKTAFEGLKALANQARASSSMDAAQRVADLNTELQLADAGKPLEGQPLDENGVPTDIVTLRGPDGEYNTSETYLRKKNLADALSKGQDRRTVINNNMPGQANQYEMKQDAEFQQKIMQTMEKASNQWQNQVAFENTVANGPRTGPVEAEINQRMGPLFVALGMSGNLVDNFNDVRALKAKIAQERVKVAQDVAGAITEKEWKILDEGLPQAYNVRDVNLNIVKAARAQAYSEFQSAAIKSRLLRDKKVSNDEAVLIGAKLFSAPRFIKTAKGIASMESFMESPKTEGMSMLEKINEWRTMSGMAPLELKEKYKEALSSF